MVYFMTKRWKNEKSRDNMRANEIKSELGMKMSKYFLRE